MKKKELLQKSVAAAAVALAATVMIPGTVRAAEDSETEIVVQNLEQSAEQTEKETQKTGLQNQEAGTESDFLQSDQNDEKVQEDVERTEKSAETTESPLPEEDSKMREENIEIEEKDSDVDTEEESEITENNNDRASVSKIPGWIIREDGTTGYLDRNGRASQNKIEEIDGVLYYFDVDEDLIKNKEFTYSNYDYKADTDGVLYRDRWDGEFYYDHNGKKQKNIVIEIEGDYYGFDENGKMYRNALFKARFETEPGYLQIKNFYAGKDGILYHDAWLEYQGKTYYFGANAVGYAGACEVEGKRYYFNTEDSDMLKDSWLYISRSPFEKSEYYFAKEDGELITGWYVGKDEEVYYFDETGRGYDGIKTIDGKEYFFYQARDCSEIPVEIKGIYYIFQKETDTLMEMKENSWTFCNGKYYYLRDGEIISNYVDMIDGALYGFNKKGQMYQNEWFDLVGWYEDGKIVWNHYYAQSDGSVCTNGWKTKGNQTFYFGKNGVAVRGLQKIGGKEYYFDNEAELVKNQNIKIEDKNYFANEDGVLHEISKTKDQWIQIDGDWYYAKSGEFLKDCIEKIGDHYSAFNAEGKLYVNTIFRKNGMGAYYYYADQNGYLKTNTWGILTNGIDKSSRYYFGKDGAASYTGIYTVDGKQYYFKMGEVQTDCTVQENGKNYICKSDGMAFELKQNGWNAFDGDWYYAKNNEIVKNGIERIGTAYYAFDEQGRMKENALFSFQENEKTIYCYAKKGGTLLTNSSIQCGDETYYFDEKGQSVNGILKLDGKEYYLENGKKVKNRGFKVGAAYYLAGKDGTLTKISGKTQWAGVDGKWYYIKNSQFMKDIVMKIGNQYYGFSTEGIMYTDTCFNVGDGVYHAKQDGTLSVNEWVYQRNGNREFYGDDGRRVENTAKKIEGNLYHFRKNLVTNEAFCEDGINYVADADGRLQVMGNNKWTQMGEYWYYVKDGRIVRNSILNLGNAYYGFDASGHMYTNTIFSICSFDTQYKIIWYSADEDGKVRSDVRVDTWKQEYYFDSSRQGYSGMKTLQNVKYYFVNGELQKNCAYTYDGVNYVSGSDGRVLTLPKNGWFQVDGYWYLVDHGRIIRNCKFDSGKWSYLFHASGYMMKNDTLTVNDVNGNMQGIYGVNEVGIVLKNAWAKQPNGNWMYFDSEGKAVNGAQSLQGSDYYFENCQVKVNRVIRRGNDVYITDENGFLHAANKNGWSKVNGYWYYFVNGKEAANTIIKIGTGYYGFDENGHMYDNVDFYLSTTDWRGYFRARSGGSLILNGSMQIGEETYYYDENGKGFNGYHTVQGNRYYFINGKMAKNTAFQDENGKYYIADAKGKCRVMNNNNWTGADGRYYYLKDGKIAQNEVITIHGVYYGFDKSGRMYTNKTFSETYQNEKTGEVEQVIYHATASGALVRNAWYEDASGKYYFDASGMGYEGTHWINGKRYVFLNGKVVG